MRLWLLFVFRGKLFGEKKSIRFIIYILQNFADIFYKILVYIEMAAFMSFRCWCSGALQRCSALPTELTSQQGAGQYVGSK